MQKWLPWWLTQWFSSLIISCMSLAYNAARRNHSLQGTVLWRSKQEQTLYTHCLVYAGNCVRYMCRQQERVSQRTSKLVKVGSLLCPRSFGSECLHVSILHQICPPISSLPISIREGWELSQHFMSKRTQNSAWPRTTWDSKELGPEGHLVNTCWPFGRWWKCPIRTSPMQLVTLASGPLCWLQAFLARPVLSRLSGVSLLTSQQFCKAGVL